MHYHYRMVYRKCGDPWKRPRQSVLGCGADHKPRMPCANGVSDWLLYVWIWLGPQCRETYQSGPSQMLQPAGEISARDPPAEHQSPDYSPQHNPGDDGKGIQHADSAVHMLLCLFHVSLESGALHSGSTSHWIWACCSSGNLSQEKRGTLFVSHILFTNYM